MATQVISRTKLIKLIHKRFDNFPEYKIRKIISCFLDEITEELADNNSVSIENFGTFSPFLKKPHKFCNVNSQTVEQTNGKIIIRFHPHYNFQSLLNRRKKFFSK